MKIDRTKALKSSFLSIEKDMGLIMQEMLKNERLKKLLFYTSADALEPDKARLTPEESLSLIGTSIKNIPKICPTPSVNTLVFITNCKNIVMYTCKQFHKVILNLVCILKFINKYIQKLVCIIIKHRFVC